MKTKIRRERIKLRVKKLNEITTIWFNADNFIVFIWVKYKYLLRKTLVERNTSRWDNHVLKHRVSFNNKKCEF